MSVQQINLFNPDFVPRRDVTTAPYLASGLIVVALLAVAGVFVAQRAGAQLIEEERRLTTEMDALRAQSESLTTQLSARKVDATLEKRLATQRAEVRTRQQVYEWLRTHTAAEENGVSEYLRALARQTVDGVWLTRFAVDSRGSNLRIEGRALTSDLVPRYLGRLGEDDLLKGRAFATVALEDASTPASSGAAPAGLTFRLETSQPAAGTSR